ncbi:hypothetical protein HF888_02975 [Bermanella marisrubri]|uniref:Alginate export domain-containing protein n=1 Tax=Bermanella marisrubri TaxID=207949 RepID=Q1N0F3_9GAMM|nr:hypothetical protein [Bermanella marisrubri]EAT11711.1 hypothetical protein RED65_06172 [Oceanobacter sp. RED65] [Bermanella marisrubri]QIZ83254.1 hypothetical protein HF888_02975 [Bermanella marisrubri]
MKTLKPVLCTLALGSMSAFASANTLQSESQSFLEDTSWSFDFRYRTESVDKDNNLDTALANTLKSRLTIKTGTAYGFSGLVEGDNTLHITDDFNSTENNQAEYQKVVDPETTQINQAYVQYSNAGNTIKLGNQRILLDNQRHVGGVGFRQDEATFDAVSISSTYFDNTKLFFAVANNRNTIKNENTEEDIILLNAQHNYSDSLKATAFYYSIETESGSNLDTFGLRSTGVLSNKASYEAEIATQDDETNTTLYYHLAGSYKLGAIKATLGLETLGSDDGDASFKTPLGTNHKFFGWSDTYLGAPDGNGLQDIYVSAVSKLAGVKLVGQFHSFSSVEDSTDLGTEFGFLAAKKFKNYGLSFKLAQFFAGDTGVDTTKLWLTATAKF